MIRYFTLLIFYFSSACIQAHGCLPLGISFDSQSEIDNFPINYPGCTIIEGDVCIGGDCDKLSGISDIKNLDGLTQLSSMGQLKIVGNDSLTDLGGLTNLNVVEGGVTLTNTHTGCPDLYP